RTSGASLPNPAVMRNVALPRLWNATRMLLVAIVGVVIGSASLAAQVATGSVTGAVLVMGADGQPLVMPGVPVALGCGPQADRTGVTDDRGEFRFSDVPAGTCTLAADLEGFKSAAVQVEIRVAATTSARLQLSVEAINDEVTVTGDDRGVGDGHLSGRVERLDAREMQTAPLANERFQDALPLIPGVVRGPDGLLNISGTRSNESGVVFNSANATDPVTGEEAIELPIDAVSSVEVRLGAYAAEYGQSAGAVTTVETEQGGARWRLQVNDLEPRPRRRGGRFVGIES